MSAKASGVEYGTLSFEGRKSLTVIEVAAAFGTTHQHIHNLIEEGLLGAVDVGGGKRKHWRIPIVEYQKFLRERASR